MSITNGYCTLAELKARLFAAHYYTATTISFTASTKTIADSAQGLKRFEMGQRILISGAASNTNNGYFTIATGGVAASIVVNETLANAVAGASITIADVSDPLDDTTLEQVIEGVSRWIDAYCNRRFYANAADEKRYYSPAYDDLLFVGDLVSITTLKTDDDGDRVYENSWAVTDYDLEPSNAALDGAPYTEIRVAPNGNYSFPVSARGVEIDGKFGWSATPKQVKEACLLQSERLFKRKDAPFGVAGDAPSGELRLIPRLDVDVQELLARLVA